MSKIKIRLKNKYIGSKNGVNSFWRYDRERVELITYFDCDHESIYLESIKRYNTYPFLIHTLWVEKTEDNKCCLMIKYNPKIIPDMGPFWGMCDTEKYVQGKIKHKYYEYNSMDEAYNDYVKNYSFAEWPTPREKYLMYRKSKSDKESFEWQIKKCSFPKRKKRNKFFENLYSPRTVHQTIFMNSWL